MNSISMMTRTLSLQGLKMRSLSSISAHSKYVSRLMDWIPLPRNWPRFFLGINRLILYLSTPQSHRNERGKDNFRYAPQKGVVYTIKLNNETLCKPTPIPHTNYLNEKFPLWLSAWVQYQLFYASYSCFYSFILLTWKLTIFCSENIPPTTHFLMCSHIKDEYS